MLFLAAATLAAVWYLFRFTTLGRRLLATGGNEKAAKMACEEVNKAMGGKGGILNVLETLTDTNTVKRQKGVNEAIAKALSADARYILLDEPTSSLTRYKAENLFRILNKLRDNGCGIIFVSHKIEEIMSLCDCVTVLRDGKAIGTKPIREITRAELAHMMIGREETLEYLGRLNISDEVVLEARDIGQAVS